MSPDRGVYGLRVEIHAPVMGYKGPHDGVALSILESNRVACHVPIFPNRKAFVVTDIRNVFVKTTLFGEPQRHPLYKREGAK